MVGARARLAHLPDRSGLAVLTTPNQRKVTTHGQATTGAYTQAKQASGTDDRAGVYQQQPHALQQQHGARATGQHSGSAAQSGGC